jgi:hypothetical protein
LRYYRAVNESYDDCICYALGGRGFFAEITTVARAMIYAWHDRKQLILESSEFAYRVRDGWNDYYEPFCRDAEEVPSRRIVERFEFVLGRNNSHFMKRCYFNPGAIRFGAFKISQIHPMIGHFMRLICRLAYDSLRQVDDLRDGLGMPASYYAVHIRRGDKVGDEDVYYSAERYLEALGDIGDTAIFVLSDDYATVEEVRDLVAALGKRNPVLTLCRPEHQGFDVWKLRAAESFAGGAEAFAGEDAYRRYVWEETSRLLAEVEIASRSKAFVSTMRSNVGRTVSYLHDRPGHCRLIGC